MFHGPRSTPSCSRCAFAGSPWVAGSQGGRRTPARSSGWLSPIRRRTSGGCHGRERAPITSHVGERLVELTGVIERLASPQRSNDVEVLLEPGPSPSLLGRCEPRRRELAVVIPAAPAGDDPAGPGQGRQGGEHLGFVDRVAVRDQRRGAEHESRRAGCGPRQHHIGIEPGTVRDPRSRGASTPGGHVPTPSRSRVPRPRRRLPSAWRRMLPLRNAVGGLRTSWSLRPP